MMGSSRLNTCIIVMSGLVCNGLVLQLVGPGWGSRTRWRQVGWRGSEFVVVMFGSRVVEFEMGVLIFDVGRREWRSGGGSIRMGVEMVDPVLRHPRGIHEVVFEVGELLLLSIRRSTARRRR